ncbi:MAG: tRNA (adenosine(37)-N6)-threonylcarbamoyltransferase complex dimerization subunit type 1 TsaB [Candidatus Omnitrophica bacterium]|nr:tRNA (adenosine(37)-N6)-threonylcarbamoyltransferase complex dimerization subunit type 1 TsaB [Candidatus Omnitrophota bacterium]
MLLLDTSSKYLSLAVAEDTKILSQMRRMLDRKHSLRLAVLIDKILKRAQVPLKKIDGFCIGRGPGSFTGLRIGITAVKGLAFVLRKPVVAIPSLDILAQAFRRIKPTAQQLCVIIDAKQNKVYSCLYRIDNNRIKRSSRYLLLPLDELMRNLKGEVLFLGDAIKIYRERIAKSKNIKASFAEEKFWYPRVAQAVSIACERFQKKRFDDANSLVPLYLYPQECQIKSRS